MIIPLKVKETELLKAECATLDSTVWRKLDIRLLPLCTCVFLVASLDRRNISNARVAGLQASLGMSNHQYALALTVYNVPFMVSQFPFALLLKHVGPNIMLPALVTLWGVLSASQGLVNNYSGFLACRFFLGLVEGGLIPGLVLYLSSFYPPMRLQVRVAPIFSFALLSATFSGLLAAGIDQMNGRGGKPGWAWIFILEGIFSFVFGIISFFLFPCSPEKAHFLTEEERAYLVSALKRTGSMSADDRKDDFSWREVIATAQSPHVWLLVAIFFFSGSILFGLAYFEPTIVAGLGYKQDQAQLMSVPPFVIAFILSLITAAVSDRYQCRGLTVIFFSLLKTIGFTVFYASKSNFIRYVSIVLSVTGVACSEPALISWLVSNSAPQTRRATAVAVTLIMTELGGIFSPWLFGSISFPPDYTIVTVTFIIMAIGMVVLSAANLAYLRRQNCLKAERRQWMRKEEEPEGLGDRSAWFIYSL